MKNFYIILLLAILFSCNEKPMNYTQVVLDNNKVNTSFLKQAQAPEKALISGYLYAYGNECLPDSDKNKCRLLTELQIENECDKDHIDFLKKWFKNDGIMQFKLRKCPNLPHTFAIQNSFDKLLLKRKGDTLSINYSIKGLNNSQEKNWNVHREDTYLIKNKSFIRID